MQEEPIFNYTSKTDLSAIGTNINLQNIVAIAAEHCFRGIVVTMDNLQELVEEIYRPVFGDKNIIPITIIDFPYGISSLDVRNYSIVAAKEKGAKEVEVMAPCGIIAKISDTSISDLERKKWTHKLCEDTRSIINTADKHGINLKYSINQNNDHLTDQVMAKLCKVICQCKISTVCLDLSNGDFQHSEEIIKMRNVKSKTGSQIKVNLGNCSIDDLSNYVKAGVDGVGLAWQGAANTVEQYSQTLTKEEG